MPKLRHFDHLNSARFFTFTCHRRVPHLNSPEPRDIVVKHLGIMRERTGTRIFGFVLMPEHIHLVLHPRDSIELGRAIGFLKSESAKEIKRVQNLSVEQTIWQPRGFDHNCRTREAVLNMIQYCHNNPVRRNLCETPTDWNWSSARWYAGIREEGLIVDDIDESTG